MPKLRFPGFEGEWERTSLGEKCKIIMGQSPDSASYNTIGVGIPLVQGNADIKNRVSCPNRHTSKPTKICRPNSVLLSVRAPVGTVGIANQTLCLGRGVCAIESDNNAFLYQFLIFKEDSWRNIEQGGTFTAINGDDIKKFTFIMPCEIEREKIATFLSLIDSSIATQRKLVELLKKHKRGLLNRIFERSKQTEEWKKYRLDQIAEINPSSESLPCEFFYIDLESVSDGVWHDKKVVKKESAPSRAQRVIQKNDILFQMVRPYQQNNLHITSSYDKPIVASTGYAQIRTSQNPSFIYWLLHSRTFLRKVLLRCTGSSYPAINSSDLKEIYVSIPPLEYQDQYARTLNSISQKCNIEESLVCHLKNLKSGLLQQMFV